MRHDRQGDVLVMCMKVNKLPEGLVPTDKVCLRYGEKTGHHHSILAGAIGYAKKSTDLVDYFVVTDETATLVHQDHNPITFGKGTYVNIHQFEYSPAALKSVQD